MEDRFKTDKNKLANTQAYRRTKLGVLTNAYNKQIERCKKYNRDIPTYSLKEFQDKFWNDNKFNSIYWAWVEGGFKKEIKPSFDRIDATKSYSFNNIQILTWQENREKGDKEKINIYTTALNMYDIQGNFIKSFNSTKDAVRETGINQSLITGCCRGKYSRAKDYVFKYRGDKFRFNHIYENPELLAKD